MSLDLRLGDCMDAAFGLPSLDDKSIDHLICDPPYSERTHGGQYKERSDNSYPTEINYSALTTAQVSALSAQMRRVTKGWILIMTDHVLVPSWEASLPGYTFAPLPIVMKGMTVRMQGDGPSSWAVWLVANRPIGLRDGTKPGAYVGSPERGKNIVIGSKPVWLMEQLIRDYTKAGDLICDPFSGGGTTGLAAKNLGRRFIGWEKNPEHHLFAKKRIEDAREQLEICA